jgi:hypothetical protein
MMKRRPYVGIAGITYAGDAQLLAHRFEVPRRDLAIGVLASGKTWRAHAKNDVEQPKYSKRYPRWSAIGEVMSPHVTGAKMVLHYALSRADGMPHFADQLTNALEATEACDGIQINGFPFDGRGVPPAFEAEIVQALRVFDPNLDDGFRVIAQMGFKSERRGAFVDVDRFLLEQRIEVLRACRHWITDVLIDASGGKGELIPVDVAAQIVGALQAALPELNIGVAGGFSADNLTRLVPLVKSYPGLSIDVESGVRTPDDDFDLGRAIAFLEAARDLFYNEPT